MSPNRRTKDDVTVSPLVRTAISLQDLVYTSTRKVNRYHLLVHGIQWEFHKEVVVAGMSRCSLGMGRRGRAGSMSGIGGMVRGGGGILLRL